MILRNAEKLKLDYTVYASFYKIKDENLDILTYRNVCDIKSNNILEGENKPDAYFVMMNPGSCHPYDEHYEIPKYNNWGDINIEMVKCFPDQAQYQVMKLMDNKQWKYVRLLNLSDIKAGNSKEFIEIISKMSNNYHSLFSNIRDVEREKIIDKDAKIVASWSKTKGIKDLAIKCKEKLDNREILGIPYDKENLHYKYIKPQLQSQKLKILEEFCTIL